MLERIVHGDIVELKLSRPPLNALSPDLVRELLAGIRQGQKDKRAIILSGRPGVFSVGIDVHAMLSIGRGPTQRFFVEFHDLCEAIGRSPVPIVAAITGHAPAGGTVLSLFCDYRVMARGQFHIGLNEVKAGVIVPRPIRVIMSRLVGARMAERLLVEGRLLTPEEAVHVGLVDETAPPDRVVEFALQYCRRLLALPPAAMNAMRDGFHEDVHRALDARDEIIDELLNDWFSEESQQNLRARA